MDCSELHERIAPLLDGELGPAEERAAYEHIEHCEACAALVERAAMVPLPGRAAPVPESPDFWAAMDRALEEEARRPTSWPRRLRGWWSAEVRVSRGAVALYLGLLAAAFLWHLWASPEGPAAPPAGVASAGPPPGEATIAPAAPIAAQPPLAPMPPQRMQKVSWEPVQQMY